MRLNIFRNWLSQVFFIVTIISCQKEVSPVPVPDDINIPKTLFDVSYGTDPLQHMDVYLPAGRNRATTKVMVMIHGGGWNSGDKADFTAFADTMKRRFPGYAIFNINYRLSARPNNLFPTQEMDVKTAITFIIKKTIQYQLSDKYVLIGASAGAHLAMLQGFKYGSPVVPKAIVSFYGPSDLKDMYNNPVGGNTMISSAIAQAMGKTPAEDIQLYVDSSPINFIGTTSPPTILLQGGADMQVSASQSTIVRDKLIVDGVNNQYVLYPLAGHGGWTDLVLFDAFNNIQSFLEANVL